MARAASTDRFRYDVDRFITTDASLVRWHETAQFSCGGQARALTVDGEGKIYVATGKRVAILDATGREIEERAGDGGEVCGCRA
jgi:sugar lactone lactonase YvrE